MRSWRAAQYCTFIILLLSCYNRYYCTIIIILLLYCTITNEGPACAPPTRPHAPAYGTRILQTCAPTPPPHARKLPHIPHTPIRARPRRHTPVGARPRRHTPAHARARLKPVQFMDMVSAGHICARKLLDATDSCGICCRDQIIGVLLIYTCFVTPYEVTCRPRDAAPEPPHAAPEPPHAAPEPPHAAPEPLHAAPEPPHAAPEPFRPRWGCWSAPRV